MLQTTYTAFFNNVLFLLFTLLVVEAGCVMFYAYTCEEKSGAGRDFVIFKSTGAEGVDDLAVG